MENTPTSKPTAATVVQHVTKASSDQLLNKFAALDSPDRPKKSFKRQKRSLYNSLSSPHVVSNTISRRESSEFGGSSSLVVERKSLLLPVRRSSAFVRIGKAHFRSRNFRNRSFFGTLEKTWRRTVDGASNIFMEKQYNRHKRLLSDT